MKNQFRILLVISILAVLTVLGMGPLPSQADSIYRYKDPTGVVRYTNCPANLTITENLTVLPEWEQKHASSLPSDKVSGQPDNTIGRHNSIPPGNPANYKTTLHQGIELFAILMEVASDITQLNHFIRSAGMLIDEDTSTTPKRALHLLQQIGQLIDQQGYIFKNPILAPADCKRSFLYTTIAEVYQLPIAIVNAPKHHFVRFMLQDGKTVNWETTQQISLPDIYYVHRLNIAPEAIRGGVYLRNLTASEQLCEFYTIAGNELRKAGHYQQALNYHHIGVSLAAKDPNALINRGVTLAFINAFEGSIEDFSLALRLDPNSAEGYYNRGMSWLNLRKPDGAIRDFDKVLTLNPAYEKAKKYRDMAMRIL